jgi:hypothetical protein
VLLVVGDRDPFVPVDHGWRLKRQLPDARLLVAPDCGHEVLLRRPALAIEALAGFYRSTEVVAARRADTTSVGAPVRTRTPAPRSSIHLGADEPDGEVIPDTDWLKEATR